VLVIVHGKGAFAGHYGNVIKQAVESGIRVIAPDLPHYGMSGPGNLDKNPARSMQDMRDVVHELVVNQLGVKQAFYLGHSLDSAYPGFGMSVLAGASQVFDGRFGALQHEPELDVFMTEQATPERVARVRDALARHLPETGR
jgi:pimeloyl-ACP methyl ester carboxylesterase